MLLTFSSKEDAIAFAEKNGKKSRNRLFAETNRKGISILLIALGFGAGTAATEAVKTSKNQHLCLCWLVVAQSGSALGFMSWQDCGALRVDDVIYTD